jgi:hypothetical protein
VFVGALFLTSLPALPHCRCAANTLQAMLSPSTTNGIEASPGGSNVCVIPPLLLQNCVAASLLSPSLSSSFPLALTSHEPSLGIAQYFCDCSRCACLTDDAPQYSIFLTRAFVLAMCAQNFETNGRYTQGQSVAVNCRAGFTRVDYDPYECTGINTWSNGRVVCEPGACARVWS